MKYLLAHDLGTSGNKCTLFDSDGTMIAHAISSYAVHWFHNGWAEQNADDWYQAICNTTQRVIQNISTKDIIGLSFSGQMMGCLCVNARGVPLYPSIIWADVRAREEESFIHEHIDPKEFYKTTGHRASCSYSLAKLLWIKNNKPEVFNNTHKVLNAKDYIIFRITGEFVTDYSDASSTNLFDINTMQWSEKIADAVDISLDMMPHAKPSPTVVGYVSKKAAEETGLTKGTPIVCGGGDGPMAAVGAMCISPGTAYGIVGTSAWNAVTSKLPIFDEEMKTFTFAHVIPGYYTPTGTMQTAGAAISWLKDHIVAHPESNDSDVYEMINDMVMSTKAGANGILFLPYLMGERSPRWNAHAKACFIGLTMESTKGELCRAVYEGIAMNLEIILRLVTKTLPVENLVLIGGGAKSRILCQILADVYNTTISIPTYVEEATSIAAAVCAGVGTEIYSNFESVKNFISIVDTVHPIPEHVHIYRQLKPIFDASYYSLESVCTELSQMKNS